MDFRIKSVKTQKFRNFMSWSAEVVAFFAGMAAAASWLGPVTNKLNFGGIWGLGLSWIIFMVAVLLWMAGIFDDGVPNRWTIYLELLLPALFSAAVGGRWGAWVDKESNKLTHWIAVKTNVYVIDGHYGTSAILVIFTIVTFAYCIFVARMWAPPRLRGNKDGESAATARDEKKSGDSTSSGSTSSTTGSRYRSGRRTAA